jgi:hypothetical protein
MNDSEPEVDPFTEALRLDLPSARDGERLRARLVSAGVLAGAHAIAPSVAAATGGGLLAKLGALPLAAKIGGSMLAVGVAALPVWDRTSNTRHAEAPKSGEPVLLDAAPAERGTPAPERLVAPVESPEPPKASSRTLAVPRPVMSPPRSTNPVPATYGSEPMPSVGSFPVAQPASIDEGTLRAETAVMERALSALRRGDHVTARRELSAHAERFPNGHLKPDRERAFERLLGKEMKP